MQHQRYLIFDCVFWEDTDRAPKSFIENIARILCVPLVNIDENWVMATEHKPLEATIEAADVFKKLFEEEWREMTPVIIFQRKTPLEVVTKISVLFARSCKEYPKFIYVK